MGWPTRYGLEAQLNAWLQKQQHACNCPHDWEMTVAPFRVRYKNIEHIDQVFEVLIHGEMIANERRSQPDKSRRRFWQP